MRNSEAITLLITILTLGASGCATQPPRPLYEGRIKSEDTVRIPKLDGTVESVKVTEFDIVYHRSEEGPDTIEFLRTIETEKDDKKTEQKVPILRMVDGNADGRLGSKDRKDQVMIYGKDGEIAYTLQHNKVTDHKNQRTYHIQFDQKGQLIVYNAFTEKGKFREDFQGLAALLGIKDSQEFQRQLRDVGHFRPNNMTEYPHIKPTDFRLDDKVITRANGAVDLSVHVAERGNWLLYSSFADAFTDAKKAVFKHFGRVPITIPQPTNLTPIGLPPPQLPSNAMRPGLDERVYGRRTGRIHYDKRPEIKQSVRRI